MEDILITGLKVIGLIVLAVIAILVIIGIIAGIIEGIKEDAKEEPNPVPSKKHLNTTESSYNPHVEIKIGNLIIHPDAIKQLGEAGAKMLQAGSVYYNRDRGVLMLEGKTREEINTPKIKQLLPHILDEDD